MNKRSPARLIATYALLFMFTFIFVFPFAWLLVTSLKDNSEAMKMPPQWVPSEVKVSNYPNAITEMRNDDTTFWNYLANTLYICGLNVVGTTFVCAVVAYGFARVQWKGRDKLFALTLATMMVPAPILMVPLFSIFSGLGWVGSYKPLWVPAFFGTAYNIFLLRQFFLSIPKELTEAAVIDGCNHFQIFYMIVLPLTKPALMVVALFNFMYHWKDFMGPLIYLNDPGQWTLAVSLQSFQSQQGGTEWSLLMAAATMMTLPIIILFFFTQKRFIEGINMTGIKG